MGAGRWAGTGDLAMARLFIDFEFTGLHQATTPLSIGVARDDGRCFYGEFTDYDVNQVDGWLRENVFESLCMPPGETYKWPCGDLWVSGERWKVRDEFMGWLGDIEGVEVWADCPAYDWVLFCELWDGALRIPEKFYYIPFDLATLFWARGVDPDVSREEFSGVHGQRHNSLCDALMIKACWERLERIERGRV